MIGIGFCEAPQPDWIGRYCQRKADHAGMCEWYGAAFAGEFPRAARAVWDEPAMLPREKVA